jgi:outer membrane protein assembly factor BamA
LLFVDSGAIDSGPYRISVGTGLQLMIPQLFGPVPMRFEFAIPLVKDEGDDIQVFSFSIAQFF